MQIKSKGNLPDWLNTPIAKTILSMENMKDVIGEDVYILMAMADRDSGISDIDMIGAYTIVDLVFYTNYFKVFDELDIAEEDRILLKGTVLDPTELPEELGDYQKAYLFCNDWWVEEYTTMQKLVDSIENVISIYDIEISDIAILAGKRCPDIMVRNLNKMIREGKYSKSGE